MHCTFDIFALFAVLPFLLYEIDSVAFLNCFALSKAFCQLFHLAYSLSTQHEQLHVQLIQQSLIIVFHVDILVFSY